MIRRFRRAASWLLGACALQLTLVSPAASGQTVPEYELKAALLYNFAVFTEWPSRRLSAEVPSFVFCILGEDPFGDSLDRLSRQRVHDKPVAVRRLAGTGEMSGCHLLFVSRFEEHSLPELIEKARESAVLTIGETNGIAERGVMVGLAIEKERVVFEVNRQAALRASLRISSKVLGLARKVY